MLGFQTYLPGVDQGGLGLGGSEEGVLLSWRTTLTQIRPESNEAHIEVEFSRLCLEIEKWSQVLLGQFCQGVVHFAI